MELYSLLEKQCCCIGLKAKTKPEMLKELAKLATQSKNLDESRVDEVITALEKREAQGSTGFGDGIAIPHARLPNMTEFVLAVGVHEAGVDFEALDKKKVHLFVLIIGPEEDVTEHLQILTAVSRGLTRTHAKKEILAAQANEAVFEAFMRNMESIGEMSGERPKMKLMVLVLFLEEYLYDVLELYLEKGIEGATVIDSVGMGEYISNVPLFATFITFFQEKKNHSKTILAMVPEGMEKELLGGIEGIMGDLDKNQGAMIFSLDVGMYKGNMKML